MSDVVTILAEDNEQDVVTILAEDDFDITPNSSNSVKSDLEDETGGDDSSSSNDETGGDDGFGDDGFGDDGFGDDSGSGGDDSDSVNDDSGSGGDDSDNNEKEDNEFYIKLKTFDNLRELNKICQRSIEVIENKEVETSIFNYLYGEFTKTIEQIDILLAGKISKVSLFKLRMINISIESKIETLINLMLEVLNIKL